MDTISPQGTAIVPDAGEAQAFLRAPPSAASVVALAPIARAILDGAGIAAIGSERVYSRCSHARSVARVARARRQLLESLAGRQLDPAVAELLLILTAEVSASASGMWELLRATIGPWHVHDGNDWVCAVDRSEAHRLLMRNMLQQFAKRRSSRYGAQKTPWPRVARLIFFAATRLSRSRDVVVLHELRRGLDRLASAVQATDRADVLTIGYAPKTWRAFLARAVRVMRGERGGIGLLPPSRVDAATQAQVLTLLSQLPADPVVARGLTVFRGLIAESCAHTAAMVEDLTRALANLRVRSVMVWDTSTPKTIAYAHAGRRAGARVLVVSHATVSVPDGAIAAPIAEIRAAQTAAGDAVDASIVQSPTVAAAVRRVAPHLEQIRATPFLWRDPPQRVPGQEDEPALFVWAGNFSRWIKHRPWVDETPDETLEGVIRLANAVIATPSVQLEVRIKPNWRIKGDIDQAALDRFVPQHERVAIRSDGSFGQSLARATAVVTHGSTALEEALRARVPVVLWGACGRAHFLRGQTIAPLGNSRAAVYAPPWDGDLAQFLAAIATAHRQEPLTDAEVAGLVWGEGTATVSDLAHILTQPDQRLAAQ